MRVLLAATLLLGLTAGCEDAHYAVALGYPYPLGYLHRTQQPAAGNFMARAMSDYTAATVPWGLRVGATFESMRSRNFDSSLRSFGPFIGATFTPYGPGGVRWYGTVETSPAYASVRTLDRGRPGAPVSREYLLQSYSAGLGLKFGPSVFLELRGTVDFAGPEYDGIGHKARYQMPLLVGFTF